MHPGVSGAPPRRSRSAHVIQPSSPASVAARSPAKLADRRWRAIAEEVVAWLKTLASAAVYATLIVTFGFQVARVEGQSMAPTLEDQDRLIVNKLAYRLCDDRRSATS